MFDGCFVYFLGHIAVLRTYMRPIVTDRVVSRSVTVVSPAKMAELIEMPFALRTRVDPVNHVIDGDPDPPWEGALLRREVGPL